MVIIILIAILLFGGLLSVFIVERASMLERIGLSFLLGIGLTTLFTFYLSWMGMKITPSNISILLLVLLAISYLLCLFLKRKPEIFIPNFRKLYFSLNWLERLILFVVILLFILSFILTIFYPVYAWDALALYDFRGKVIAELGYFVQRQSQFEYFAHYPLLTSLTHTFIFIFGGTNPQFTYSIYYMVFICIFFSQIKSDVGRLAAFISVLFLVTNPDIFQHSIISYTNLPYTVFYVVGVLYLYKALTSNRNNLIALSSILIGLSTWARSDEPFWLTGSLLILIYSIYKKSLLPIILYSPIFLLIQRPWMTFVTNIFGQALSTTGQINLVGNALTSGIDIQRVGNILIYLYKNVVQSWGLICMPFLIAVAINIKSGFNKNHTLLLIIIIINLLGLIAGAYVFSLNVPEWKDIPDSASRLAMFFPSLMIYYTTLVLTSTFSMNKRKS